MGGKSGGSSGPSAAEIAANDARLREQWDADRAIYDEKRAAEETEKREVAEQGRRDDLWATASSDYDKVYDMYKKNFDVDAELASRQGTYGTTGANVLKSNNKDQNKLAQAEAKGTWDYTGKQEEIDGLNKEMDRLQAIEFDTGGKVGSQLKGETMSRFEKKPKGTQTSGLTEDDEEFKFAKALGGI